jgi:hypothetical protein
MSPTVLTCVVSKPTCVAYSPQVMSPTSMTQSAAASSGQVTVQVNPFTGAPTMASQAQTIRTPSPGMQVHVEDMYSFDKYLSDRPVDQPTASPAQASGSATRPCHVHYPGHPQSYGPSSFQTPESSSEYYSALNATAVDVHVPSGDSVNLDAGPLQTQPCSARGNLLACMSNCPSRC